MCQAYYPGSFSTFYLTSHHKLELTFFHILNDSLRDSFLWISYLFFKLSFLLRWKFSIKKNLSHWFFRTLYFESINSFLISCFEIFLLFQCIEAFGFYIVDHFFLLFLFVVWHLGKNFNFNNTFSSNLMLLLLKSLILLEFIWYKKCRNIYFYFLKCLPTYTIHFITLKSPTKIIIKVPPSSYNKF